jgi:hypothetical protein
MTASTSYMAKGLTLLMDFVSVPLTVHYLGAERYGVWLTISSLLLWVVRGTTLLGSRVYWFKYAGGVTVSGHRTTSDRPTPACPSGRAPSRTGRTTPKMSHNLEAKIQVAAGPKVPQLARLQPMLVPTTTSSARPASYELSCVAASLSLRLCRI